MTQCEGADARVMAIQVMPMRVIVMMHDHDHGDGRIDDPGRLCLQRFGIQPAAHVGDFLVRIVKAEVEQAAGICVAMRAIELDRGRIERLEPGAQRREPGIVRRQKIALADHQPVGDRSLFDRFLVPSSVAAPFNASTRLITPSSRRRSMK